MCVRSKKLGPCALLILPFRLVAALLAPAPSSSPPPNAPPTPTPAVLRLSLDTEYDVRHCQRLAQRRCAVTSHPLEPVVKSDGFVSSCLFCPSVLATWL